MTTTTTSSSSGIAGRTNYAHWDKVATHLVHEARLEEDEEIAQGKQALGLDGKYPRSQAEQDEHAKAAKVKKAKKTLEKYQKREQNVMQILSALLGPVVTAAKEEGHSDSNSKMEPKTVRITRDHMQAGKRVVTVCDTTGSSPSRNDTIVLTQDLSLIESTMPTTTSTNAQQQDPQHHHSNNRPVFGIIKAFLTNLHNCTILVKCKLIAGVIEVHRCSNINIVLDHNTTCATLQIDLSQNVHVEFVNAPSGKNTVAKHSYPNYMYWGQDKDDRIYHAGVSNLHIKLVHDDEADALEITCDYLNDGAVAIGNATAEEYPFVTSVVNGTLLTEAIQRAGRSTGANARAMTEREWKQVEASREAAAASAAASMADSIQIKDKHGNLVPIATAINKENGGDDDDVEEIYTGMSAMEIQEIVKECEQNKSRGNEAFGAGEYGQAILLYSLALDKADELPDTSSITASKQQKPLFPRDVLLSNRAACFLKLGQHEKAQVDAARALQLNPDNIKANFRLGLALHAMQRYHEALPVLAKAHQIEPHNKQVTQALQFCEVRLAQEERKRMS